MKSTILGSTHSKSFESFSLRCRPSPSSFVHSFTCSFNTRSWSAFLGLSLPSGGEGRHPLL